jgi:hypothetical protein
MPDLFLPPSISNILENLYGKSNDLKSMDFKYNQNSKESFNLNEFSEFLRSLNFNKAAQ